MLRFNGLSNSIIFHILLGEPMVGPFNRMVMTVKYKRVQANSNKYTLVNLTQVQTRKTHFVDSNELSTNANVKNNEQFRYSFDHSHARQAGRDLEAAASDNSSRRSLSAVSIVPLSARVRCRRPGIADSFSYHKSMLAPAIGHGISLDGLVISAVKFRSRATWATLPLPGKSSASLGCSPISGAVTRWRDVRFSNAATIWLLAAAGSATDSPTAGAHALIGVIQISIFDLRICSASQQLERAEGKKLVRYFFQEW
ncbi:hypothetical protein T4A_9873 [Trichinella pseudospiralis]|uniref:Uncharacterized protein n=1 Tax=Trichinella pseudospiralis TaxID=6337 RepID=A0A0V1EU52_TRIPS|nr:hypothetical protein T4A_9873 [Trichinella pseudospiralis]